ncbi:MAG: hypothetical protein MK538_02240 [Planctomycetes bacterium]|nr:hypothetical protein [Planctomycetota bacterium]
MLFGRRQRRTCGAALVEYALLIAGVGLIAAAAVAIFGHKTSDMVAATAAILPGAHPDDNGPIVSGKVIETGTPSGGDPSADNPLALDINSIIANAGNPRLNDNLGLGAGDGEGQLAQLVVEAGEEED